MTDLDKDATIRARWPGEAGQHLALATVSATKQSILAAQRDLGTTIKEVKLPLNPGNCADAIDISSSEKFEQ